MAWVSGWGPRRTREWPSKPGDQHLRAGFSFHFMSRILQMGQWRRGEVVSGAAQEGPLTGRKVLQVFTVREVPRGAGRGPAEFS